MEKAQVDVNVDHSFAPDNFVNGRYKIIKELGRGGMGIVFLVEDTARDNDIIVLKVFQSGNANEELIESLRTEFAILSAMRHPNLVGVFDFGKISGKREYFFTMEYIKGMEFLQAVKILPESDLKTLFIQLVQALDYIHASGIYHGDIKSENIIIYKDIDNNYNLKLMDFGLAVKEKEKITRSSGGTLEYLAPELFQNAPLNITTDLYAVGVLMFWAYTGQAPFGGSPEDIKNGHLKKQPSRISTLKSDIAPEIDAAVFRMLAKDPVERFSSSEELLAALGVEQYDTSRNSDLIAPLIWDSFLKLRAREINDLYQHIIAIVDKNNTTKPDNFIIIKGNEGSGHNRIIDELKYRLQIQEIKVLEGWCRNDKSTLYEPLIDIFKGYQEIENFIHNSYTKLMSNRSGKDDMQLVRLKFMDEICGKIRLFTRSTPIVLLIRDIELANEGMIDLIHYMGRLLVKENIALVVSITTDKQSQDISLQLQKGRDSLNSVHEFRVTRVDETEIERLMNTAFINHLFPQNFFRELFNNTGGNPEIIAAVLTALHKSGLFTRSDKTWMLSDKYDLAGLDLKDINKLYLETFSSLPDLQKNITKIASVHDFAINKTVFIKLLDISEEKFDYEIGFLLDKRIFLTSQTDSTVNYYFLSNVFKDAVYELIPENERQSLHLQIIQIYQAVGDRLQLSIEQKAYHLLKAGVLDKGLPMASRAYHKLKNSYSNRRALFISRLSLLKCGETKKRYCRVFRRHVADIEDTLGDSAEALKNYSDLLELYKNGIAKSALLRRISSLHQKLGNLESAAENLNLALSLVPDHAVIERALILRELSWLSLIQGQYQQSMELGKNALDILPANSPTRTLALTLNNLGGASFYAGNIEQAVIYFAKSAQVKNDLGDRRSMAATLNNLGIVHNVSGDHKKAREYWVKSLEIMEQIGDMAGLAETYNNLGILLMESGQYERALNYYKKCKDLKNRIGDIRGLVAAHCNTGELLFLREDYSQALDALDEGIKFAERINSYSDKAEMLYQKARVYIALNHLEYAMLAIDGCLKLSETDKDQAKLGEYYVLKAWLTWLTENQFENSYLHKAEEIFVKDNNQNLGVLLNLAYLRYYTEIKSVAQALDRFHKINKIIESSNYRWHQVQLLILFAKTLMLDNRPAHLIEKILDRSEDMAKSMGLLLQIKSIYLLRGLLSGKSGDYVTGYKHLRKAYQCLKLCMAHIVQDDFKKSILTQPENIELLQNIKQIKESIKTGR
ncbi:MAG TPA: serine/threonine-protein kinase [bacterium]|nr:serine/threonine-protein kinase [bacterium]HPN44808.1 serine/threonine-protein kinase [bacterium]